MVGESLTDMAVNRLEEEAVNRGVNAKVAKRVSKVGKKAASNYVGGSVTGDAYVYSYQGLMGPAHPAMGPYNRGSGKGKRGGSFLLS